MKIVKQPLEKTKLRLILLFGSICSSQIEIKSLDPVLSNIARSKAAVRQMIRIPEALKLRHLKMAQFI